MKPDLRWALWLWAVLAILVMGLVGVWVAPDRPLSLLRFGALVLGLGVYALTRLLVSAPRRFWLAFGVLPALGLGLSALGLAGTFWLTYKLPFTALIVALLPRLPESWLSQAGPAAGLHPNPMSALITLVLLPLAGLLLFSAGVAEPRHRAPLRWAAWAACLVMLAYLALAVSRSALLALGVAGLILLSRHSRRLAWLAVALGGAAVLAGALLWQPLSATLFFSDLLTPGTYPGSSRLAIWPFGLQLLAGAPLTGIGLGAFPSLALAAGVGAPEYIAHAHNLALQAALDLGLPGALAYLGLVLHAGLSAARAGRQLMRGPAAGAAWGLAAAVLAFGLFGLVDTITVTARAGVIVWFVLGLAAAAPVLTRPHPLAPLPASPHGHGPQPDRSG